MHDAAAPIDGPTAAAVAPALRVRGLQKRFGPVAVLHGVDLDVRPGEILALVGENGAGKSTVVRCATRTLPADAGRIEVAGAPLAADPIGARDQGIAVVWQDLALCENLSVVANLFLGAEQLARGLLDETAMVQEGRELFRRLDLTGIDLQRPVGTLSGGQRQLVAIAKAVRREPAVLILDEPTASLGVTETRLVERVLADLRDHGTAVLLVSHRLDQVFQLADRIAILRDGRVRAEVSPLEVHPDDVVAMMSGVETDSTAGRQLRRLQELVEQLAEVEPNASLPLIVSALVEALGADQLCLHLLEADDVGTAVLRRSATVGVPAAVAAALEALPPTEAGGPPGRAAATRDVVVVDDLRRDAAWGAVTGPAGRALRRAWSVPILGSGGVLGTLTGFGVTAGRPRDDQLELVRLYASLAATAIEREHLLADATRRNRLLETLRGVLDTLAGPEPAQGGLAVALLALCRGLGADAIALHTTGDWTALSPAELTPAEGRRAAERQQAAAAAVLQGPARLDRARPVGDDVLAVPIAAPEGRAVVTAWWADHDRLGNDALDLLDDAARSLRLALERQALERASAEAASLRRSQQLQRDFLSRLNHELRTPLTAIQGYASTLRQDDVTWDVSSQERFLDSIASESARMGRLVGDLLDFSAIDSGTLRLVPDWCDLGLVVDAALRCIGEAPPIELVVEDGPGLPPIWGDHDRLEQVFVNLLDNAVRHSGAGRVVVRIELAPDAGTVAIRVADDGTGIAPDLAERVFLPHERGATTAAGAGLGLAIARGIVDAHRGTIGLEPSERGATVVVRLPVEPEGGGRG